MTTSARWRQQRQTILAEIINDHAYEDLSYRELHLLMMQNQQIAEKQPTYSVMTCYRDWCELRDELKERREEFASFYIATQLEATDRLLDDLLGEYDKLNNEDPDLIDDTVKRIRAKVAIAGAKKRLVEAMDKLFYRQHTLVPMSVPRELNVRSAKIEFTLDDYMRLKAEHTAQLAENTEEVIEGQVLDSNTR